MKFCIKSASAVINKSVKLPTHSYGPMQSRFKKFSFTSITVNLKLPCKIVNIIYRPLYRICGSLLEQNNWLLIFIMLNF